VDFSDTIYPSFSPINNNLTKWNLEIEDNLRDIYLWANTPSGVVTEEFAG
jgi:hypothetical protein